MTAFFEPDAFPTRPRGSRPAREAAAERVMRRRVGSKAMENIVRKDGLNEIVYITIGGSVVQAGAGIEDSIALRRDHVSVFSGTRRCEGGVRAGLAGVILVCGCWFSGPRGYGAAGIAGEWAEPQHQPA